MYKFVDTTESQEEQELPSEALNFNGVYFENVIPGYRTLYVSGREMIENRNIKYGYGNLDGARYRRKTIWRKNDCCRVPVDCTI